jgi:ribose transport system permease protein
MDMSLGGIICMAGALGIIGSETNPWIMFPVILMVCVSSELFIGGVHILLNIPSVIVSFAVSFFGRGIAGFLIANRTRGLKLPGMFDILYNRLLFFAITIISIVIITMVFHYTKAGKYVMSIGSNLNAARAAGINITKYKILGFGITGLMMALATTMTVARAGGAGATSGAGFEIDILLMIVIGGVSLNGGTKTKVFSVIVGAFVLLCLENGLTIVGFSPNVIGVVKGVIFLCAVGMTFDRDGVPYII